MFKINKLRSLWAKTRNAQRSTSRDDEGFSFAQVIVTMVIVGILGGAIGFTAFQFIGQSRETVLAANIRTAAEAVQNTMALNPDLKTATAGVPGPALISELSNVAGFTWEGGAFPFVANDGVETVRIQMLGKATAATAATGTAPPNVPWLVGEWDAVRLQIKNEDNAWACALIVLRPDWTTGSADQKATAEGNLRGIWYDAGSSIPTDTTSDEVNGAHHCSPTTVEDMVPGIGNTTAGDATAAAKGPLPVSGSLWIIPGVATATATPNHDEGTNGADDTTGAASPDGNDDVRSRTLLRAVPAFSEG